MNRSFIALMLTSILYAYGCGENASEEKADMIFLNGKIYTVDEENPWADAVAIKDNKIIFVGSTMGAHDFFGENTKAKDLKGKMMMPGFVSTHDHLISSRWTSSGLQLFGAKNKDEYKTLIKNYAEANPDIEIIQGIGWDPEIYGGLPSASELDAILPDRPAFLIDFTGQDAWLNTRALEAGGINKETVDPKPGVSYWKRDDEGIPTGVGVDKVWFDAFVKSGAWQPETMIPESMNFLYTIASRHGTTTFQNPGILTPNSFNPELAKEDYRVIMEMISKMDADGKLKIRTMTMPSFNSDAEDPEDVAKFAEEMHNLYNSDMLRMSGIIVHPEGYWTSNEDVISDSYSNGPGFDESLSVSLGRMKEVIKTSNSRGIDVAIQTDGSAAVRVALDAIEYGYSEGYNDSRNSLHHLIWTMPDDYKRIVDLKIPVNITPAFSTDWSVQEEEMTQYLEGDSAIEQVSVYGDLSRSGNSISLSADVPSTTLRMLAPLFCVESAITLQDPVNPVSKPFPPNKEPMSLEDALKAITIDAAWQLRMEDKIGSIEVGKYADFVILDQNLFEIEKRDIEDVRILATIMNGKYIHEARAKTKFH